MVFGYLLATGIETTVELSVWGVKKIGSFVYYAMYPEEEVETETERELRELRKEIGELKDLIKQRETTT